MRNITDPDSRLMPVRGGGFIQGYNAQNITSEDELIIATELTDDPVDCRWFEPMLGQAQDAAALIEAHRPAGGPARWPGHGGSSGSGIGLALADAGYCSEANLTCPGPDRLIAVGKHRDLEKAARGQDGAGADWGGPAVQAMRARLKTDDGIAAYRQRGHIAETPHGHIKHNMGIRQLSMRGKPKPAPNGSSSAPCTTCSRPSPPATSPPRPWQPWPADRPDGPPGPARPGDPVMHPPPESIPQQPVCHLR